MENILTMLPGRKMKKNLNEVILYNSETCTDKNEKLKWFCFTWEGRCSEQYFPEGMTLEH